MMKVLALSILSALLLGVGAGVATTDCTPAQSAAISADAQEALTILSTLEPVACAIVDAVDHANGQAVCQVITDVTTGAVAIVPVFGSVVALTQVVAQRPANSAVTQAAAGITPATKALLRSLAAKRVRR